jgi:hypothetical protein
MSVLLMLLSLAFAGVILLGAAAVELGREKSLRASSLRRRPGSRSAASSPEAAFWQFRLPTVYSNSKL